MSQVVKDNGMNRVNRIAKLLLLSVALGAAACSDATGPGGPAPITLQPPAPGSPLYVAAGALEDATFHFLPSITNAATQTSLRETIRSISSNLFLGDYAKARTGLASGRGILAALNAVESVELAGVGVAFDFVDAIMTTAGK